MQRTEGAWEPDADQSHSFLSSPEVTVQKTVVLILRLWLPCTAAREHDSQALTSYAWGRKEIPHYGHTLITTGFRAKQMTFCISALSVKIWIVLSELSAFHSLSFPNCDVVRMMKLDLTGASAGIQKVNMVNHWWSWAQDLAGRKHKKVGLLGVWVRVANNDVCLWLFRRLSWRELPTLQRLSTVSLATTTSSQPLLILRSMQGWWGWTPSVDNWLWMSLRHHKPPIKVRSLFPLPLDKLNLPPLLPLPFTWHQILYIYIYFIPKEEIIHLCESNIVLRFCF